MSTARTTPAQKPRGLTRSSILPLRFCPFPSLMRASPFHTWDNSTVAQEQFIITHPPLLLPRVVSSRDTRKLANRTRIFRQFLSGFYGNAVNFRIAHARVRHHRQQAALLGVLLFR